ncbi:unnamed protein product [marine sediment metagenome]|uniref:Uncharacterized protein n=1 Tax=marine sediment metagenome TaxID=412755 RepID=X1L7F2_9ZZZZ
MIIEIWETRFPPSVDRNQVEDFVNNVWKPAGEKAGYKMIRWTWMHTGQPVEELVVIGELESLADVDKVWTIKEMQEAAAEWGRRFPNAEGGRTKILEVI